MGESSAKNLRGASMADVIFNGSRDRKPLGQAFVELIFDNNEGRLLGEYAAYSEIAIKRLVTREGQSTYYLNGTVCRRKDVVDIFLGTGLGPRSYSIIGQGTISRIIEAKPDEFRVFLEEAAGISKYKEKRRETENRIKHTQENLSRVNDIREELAKQLERLQRQAKAAEKFKILKTEERERRAQLQALRWQVLNQDIEVLDKTINTFRVRIEETNAKQSRLDAEMHEKREAFEAANQTYNQTQATVYRIGTDIARFEEAINHKKERREKLEQNLNQAKSDWQQTATHYEGYVIKINELTQAISTMTPLLAILKEEVGQKQTLFNDAEVEKEKDREQWEQFNQESAESSKEAHGEQTRIQQLEERMGTVKKRIEKLVDEKTHLVVEPVSLEIDTLSEELEILQEKQDTQKESFETLTVRVRECKANHEEKEREVFEVKETLQTLKASLASLQALQEAALGRRETEQGSWLKENQLDNAPRLGERFSVESAWEKAVEVVLGDRLQALCIDDFNVVSKTVADITQGAFTLLNQSASLKANVACDKPALYDKVTSDLPMAKNMLTGIYCAEDIETALSWLEDILPHESIVTKDGVLLGQGWCRVIKRKDETEGLLAREKSIVVCLDKIEVEEANLSDKQAALETLDETFSELEAEKEASQAFLNETTNALYEVKSKRSIKENQLTQLSNRALAIDEDVKDEEVSLLDFQSHLQAAKDIWQNAMSKMEVNAQKREALLASREAVTKALENAKNELKLKQDEYHENELLLKTRESELSLAKDASDREKRLSTALKERIESLILEKEALLEEDKLSLEEKLEAALKTHVEAEERLQLANKSLEDIKGDLSSLEKNREETHKTQEEEKEKLNVHRMDKQALLVRAQTIQESLKEDNQEIKEVVAKLPPEADEKVWEEELSRIGTRISRLGAINLAAIDEFEVESERKQYLDNQCDDLNEALDTLEAAMNKIDKETKTRFKETFDEVNERFGSLFPRLFGGGEAYLELTSDDLLTSGVSVMARPPGKRNATIHLLSGGEKAMSAVALVFAIFQLNPSPFCMLDEVDAPLDDSNVGRFCAMVKEMSTKVQFILITHNKVTMELADHLVGVTMQEPGVSRLVSVDVEKAVALTS
jgi:chromosome segregation protein